MVGSWLGQAARAPSAAALASCLCRISASLTAVTCPCVLRHLSTHPPLKINGTSISGSPGCQGFVGMGGSEALPPPPPPLLGVLPAALAGCSLWLCPELSAWSSPMALPRAPAAWVLQSLNPLLGVEPGQGSGEVLPCSRLQQLLPFLLTLGIVCSHHCLGFLPGWRMLSHPVNPLLSGHGGMGGWKGRSRGGHNPPPSQGIHSWAVALGVKSDSCMPVLRHLRVHPHSWQMCWVLPAPPFPGCCQVELGWCPALTMKEGLVQGDGALLGLYQCFISELCSGASPWLLWNPVPHQCVRYGVSAPQDPGPCSGQR